MESWLVGMSLWESLGEIAGLLLVFFLILVLTWLTTRWIAGHTAGQMESGNIKVIETYKLAQNRYLQIVQIAGRYLVLAISRDQITLITELSEEEVKTPESRVSGQISFQDILKRLQKQKEEKK